MFMKRILFSLLLTSVSAVSATGHPADQIKITVPPQVNISAGRAAEFSLSLSVPANHHVYLKHANANGKAMPVHFSVSASSGFQLAENGRPRGLRVGNEFVLRGTGRFRLQLSELAMNEFGKSYTLALALRVQICEEGDVGICYMPMTIERPLTVTIDGPEMQTRDLPDSTLPWVNSHATALEAAKLKNQNVFALISDPSRCGACAQLEKRVLPDAKVNKMLRTQFVVYRVPRNEYSKAPISGSFGIPFYFIISPQGENLQKWMGAPGAPQFAARLEPYARGGEAAPATAPSVATNSIPLNSGGKQCAIPLKQSFAFQSTQKGEFISSGNMRFVANASQPGAYTVLTLDRTGEIDSSNSARVAQGKLVVEKYLGGNDLVFECSQYGINGVVPAQSLVLGIELR
jgi:hypothetical protein